MRQGVGTPASNPGSDPLTVTAPAYLGERSEATLILPSNDARGPPCPQSKSPLIGNAASAISVDANWNSTRAPRVVETAPDPRKGPFSDVAEASRSISANASGAAPSAKFNRPLLTIRRSSATRLASAANVA